MGWTNPCYQAQQGCEKCSHKNSFYLYLQGFTSYMHKSKKIKNHKQNTSGKKKYETTNQFTTHNTRAAEVFNLCKSHLHKTNNSHLHKNKLNTTLGMIRQT